MSGHKYDVGGKWLQEHWGGSLLRLAGVSGIVSWKARQAEVVHPGQLPDGLLEVQIVDCPDFVYFLLELATKAERRLTRQLIRGMMLVYLEFGVLPEVVTLVYHRHGQYRVPTAAELRSTLGTSHCALSWRVVELWTLPAEELLAANDVGLIPWVPLTHYDGPLETLLYECRERIDRQAPADERTNLLAVTQIMAGLRTSDPQLLQILGGRRGMIIDSPVLRNLIDEVEAKAVAKAKQAAIVRVLRGRFGTVPRDIAKALLRRKRESMLDELIDRAATCRDLDAFRAGLSS